MSELSRDAMLARQAGMSYGKWRALQPPEVKKEKQTPEGWAECEQCGKLFRKQRTKRYCDFDCRRKAYAEREKALYAERYRRKKERMAENGM